MSQVGSRHHHGRSLSASGNAWSKRPARKIPFSVIVVGTSGTGKTAFINTLVGHQVVEPTQMTKGRLTIRPTAVEVEDADGSRLLLTIIDTPGFGDKINSSEDIDTIATYIETKFDEVLAEESRIRRNPRFKDDRIDACLYFIEPTGHGLREIDILALKRLSNIVNIIPVLARADTLTTAERLTNKRLVMEDIDHYHIKIFDFLSPYGGEDDNDTADSSPAYDDAGYEAERAAVVAKALPWAISSSSEFDSEGKSLYRRKLVHGAVDVLNPEYSDFQLLRDTLLESHLPDLKESTRELLYESYRTARLDPRKTHRSSLLLPEELAEHAARLKEAQLQRESQQLREQEQRIYEDIEKKRQQLAQREKELRELELRMADARTQQQIQLQSKSQTSVVSTITASETLADASAGTSPGGLAAEKEAELVQAQNQIKSEMATIAAEKESLQVKAAGTTAAIPPGYDGTNATAAAAAKAASLSAPTSAPPLPPNPTPPIPPSQLNYIQENTTPLQIKKSNNQ